MRRPQSAASYVSKSKKCPDALSRALLSRELYIRTPTIRSSRLPLKEKIKRLETAIIKERAHSPPASRSPSPHQRPPSPIHVPGNNYPPVPESPVVIHNTWVMPCHKSEDEIIAEADYRIRKQLYAKDIQVKVLNGIRTRVDAKLQLRQERIASATEKIELMRRQSTGLTIIQAVRFVYYLSARLKVQRRIDAANRVPVYSFGGTQVVIKTQEDLSKHEEFKEKYIRFLEVAHKYKWRLQFAVNIMRKRMATKIIKTWAQELRSVPTIKKSAHNYIVKVNVIQRAVRSFLSTRRARIRMLAIVWDKEEFKYVKKQLIKLRKEKEEKNLDKTLDEYQTVPLSIRRGIQDRVARWKYTNAKMKALLKKHDDDSSVKVDSPLDVESDDEEFVSDPYVRQHLAPYDVKENALFEIVKEKRKEYLAYVEKRKLACTVLQTSYTVDDARLYIAGLGTQGGPAPGSQVITALMKFNMFSMLGDTEIRDRVIFVHKRLKTFESKKLSIFDRKTSVLAGSISAALRSKGGKSTKK